MSGSFIAQGKNEFGRSEYLVGFQLILGRIRIDGRNDTQVAYVVHFERKAEVSGPSDCSHQYFSFVFISRLVQSDFEERLHVHGCTAAQFRIQDFLARLKLLGTHLHFFCPVAAELCQVITGTVEVKHGRGISPQSDRFLFLMFDFAPGLDDVFFGVCHIMQGNVYRIFVVAQVDGGLRTSLYWLG